MNDKVVKFFVGFELFKSKWTLIVLQILFILCVVTDSNLILRLCLLINIKNNLRGVVWCVQ